MPDVQPAAQHSAGPPPRGDAGGTIVANGGDVIRQEAAALERLAAGLDARFATAANVLAAIAGRVVVAGIGKSGHVARKIAATFASTGTPALFLHPAEAAHGDLGMLVPGDALLLLSNSGSTAELLPLAHHAQRLAVPVVTISAAPGSILMTLADVALALPKVAEAGPGGLAPTTSTAMMMGLGDALAMAAMELRGWSRAGFGALHPGGALGSRLGRVASVMHGREALPLVAPDTPMRDVILTMTAHSFGIAGVVDPAGDLVGVITDGDLRRHAAVLLEGSADAVMTVNPVTTGPDTAAEVALAAMRRHQVTALFVIDPARARRPVGLVHVHDFLRLGIV